MSQKYKGGFITKNAPEPTKFGATGVWTLDQMMQAKQAGTWPIASYGALYTWGENTYNNLGVNQAPATYSTSPLQVGANSNTVTPFYETSTTNTAVVKGNGSLWMWGDNTYGHLGDGTTTFRSSPVQVGTLTNWLNISPGLNHTLAIKTDGTLWGWGFNFYGSLGDGTTVDRSSPVQIGTLTTWSKVKAGNNFSGAIKTDGTLWVWGINDAGQLGNSSTLNRSSPIQIGALTWIDFTIGDQTTIAIQANNSLWSWGNNTSGILGDNLGTTTKRSSPVQVGTLTNWSKLSSYVPNTCSSIKTDGTLWAWGYNGNGTLGDNSVINRSSPVQIGTLTDWSNVSTGRATYAIKTDGSLWAWGYNQYGTLGDGTTVNSSSPIQVGNKQKIWSSAKCAYSTVIFADKTNTFFTSGLNAQGQLGNGTVVYRSSPVQIGAASYWGQPASGGVSGQEIIKYNGTLWAWGRNNDYGQLGDGTTIDKSSPVQIGTLTNWLKISAQLYRSAAIKTDGTLWSWGAGTAGGLGDGTTISKSSPIQIGTLTTWSNVAVGSSSYNATMGILLNGQLWMWGRNTYGTLGTGTTISRSSPVQVGSLENWNQIATNGDSAYSIKTDNTLWAWGRNAYGELGDITTINKSSPIQIGTLTNWAQIATDGNYVAAVKTDGSLWGWGSNTGGQIGDGTTIHRSSPVQVGTLTNWASVSCGADATYATKTDGTIWSWGANGVGQLGDGTTDQKSSPVQIGTLTTWTSLIGGDAGVSATKADGSLWMWGDNSIGQLGQNAVTLFTSFSAPTQVGTLTDWKYLAMSQTGLAIKNDGSLWTWGRNDDGASGLGDTVMRSSPVQVGTLTNWSSLGGSNQSAAAVKTDGSLWAWGYNVSGSLGDGTAGSLASKSSPIQIGTLTNWAQVSMTPGGAAAVKTDKTLWTWGLSTYGQLGKGNTTDRSSPVQVGTLTNWAQVSSANNFKCAVKTDGTLWSWGYNNTGQLGDGTTQSRSSPVQIGTLTTWSNVSANNLNGYAVKTDGTLWAWGDNGNGQIGNNTVTVYSSPVQIGTLTNWYSVFANAANGATAIKTDGTLWGWGSNSYYQIGDGTSIDRSSPVQIGALSNWITVGYMPNPSNGAILSQG